MNIATFIMIFGFVIFPQLLSGGASLVNDTILSEHSGFNGLELLTGGVRILNYVK